MEVDDGLEEELNHVQAPFCLLDLVDCFGFLLGLQVLLDLILHFG